MPSFQLAQNRSMSVTLSWSMLTHPRCWAISLKLVREGAVFVQRVRSDVTVRAFGQEGLG